MPKIIVNGKGAFLTNDFGDVTDRPDTVILDGATGSEVDKKLAEQGQEVDALQKGSDFRAPINAPDVLGDVHFSHLEAGARIVTADSFCANFARNIWRHRIVYTARTGC